jgi:hypothetical protein
MRLDLVKVLGVSQTIADVEVDGKPFSDFLYNFLDKVRT